MNTINKVFVMVEDYNNLFISNIADCRAEYQELPMTSRNINKNYYEDLFVLEPHHYYYITFNEAIENPQSFHFALLSNALFYQFDTVNQRLYIYNCGNNIVYIQKNANLIRGENDG